MVYTVPKFSGAGRQEEPELKANLGYIVKQGGTGE